MVVLAVIPVLGLAQITVFGALALLSLLSLAVTVWLPSTPEHSSVDAITDTAAEPSKSPRRVMIAGIGILIVFPLWGTSEDAVWTLAPVLGGAVDLGEQSLGFALSAAARGGAGGTVAATLSGGRGR